MDAHADGASPADSADPRASNDNINEGNANHGLDEIAPAITAKLKGKRSRGQLRGLTRKKTRR